MKTILLSGLMIIMAFSYPQRVVDKDHASPPGIELASDQIDMEIDRVDLPQVAEMEIEYAPVAFINDNLPEMIPFDELSETRYGSIVANVEEGARSIFKQEKGTSFDRWCTGTC